MAETVNIGATLIRAGASLPDTLLVEGGLFQQGLQQRIVEQPED